MRGVIRYRRRLNDEGETEESCRYFLDLGGSKGEVEVTKEEYLAHFPDKPLGEFASSADWKEPVISEGASVNPNRIKDWEAHCNKHGVPTDFHSEGGRPVIRNRAHRKKLLKLMRLHDQDGGYGD